MAIPRFSRLTVKTRIGLGFGVILLMMVLLTVVGVIQVNAISHGLQSIGDVNSVKQRYAINFRGSVHDRAISLRDVTLVDNDMELRAAIDDIARLASDYEKSAVLLDRMFQERTDISEKEREILRSIKQIEAHTLPLIERVSALRRAGDVDQAVALMLNEARPAFVEWLARINQFIDLQEAMNQTESAQARAIASGFQTLMVLVCGVALFVGAVVAAIIIRNLSAALGGEPEEARDVANSISAGDLSTHIHTNDRDRSSVLFAMKEMRDSLKRIVAEVRTVSTRIATVASGNRDLSSRTRQQATALEDTASSMAQMTSTVRQNADNAQQAHQLALSASSVAVRGGEAVSQVVNTMGEINDSARKIADIISVIDSIAFQTNILALNAAVEAARAGEQGRGFAVVATEVRSLAQRSAGAAKEIKSLIDDSVQKVDNGSRLVTQAGSTMTEIVDSVKRVTDIMADIMSASQEQRAGIEQVNQALAQMDTATQQNANMVDEAAAAAESLQEQAEKLTQVVSVFKTDSPSESYATESVSRSSPAISLLAPRLLSPK